MGVETLRLGGKLEQGERSGIKLGSVLVLIKIPKRESQEEREGPSTAKKKGVCSLSAVDNCDLMH